MDNLARKQNAANFSAEPEISLNKKVILGMQHTFTMFGATVLVPIITGFDISVALFSAGIPWFFIRIHRSSNGGNGSLQHSIRTGGTRRSRSCIPRYGRSDKHFRNRKNNQLLSSDNHRPDNNCNRPQTCSYRNRHGKRKLDACYRKFRNSNGSKHIRKRFLEGSSRSCGTYWRICILYCYRPR